MYIFSYGTCTEYQELKFSLSVHFIDQKIVLGLRILVSLRALPCYVRRSPTVGNKNTYYDRGVYICSLKSNDESLFVFLP